MSVDEFESASSTKVENPSIMAVDERAIAVFGATEHIPDTEGGTTRLSHSRSYLQAKTCSKLRRISTAIALPGPP